MRLALLSDIHGNAVALGEVLACLEALDIDQVHVLGDVVGYLPEEQRCLELLAAAGATFLRGNHEQMLLADPDSVPSEQEAVYHLEPTRARMAGSTMEQLRGWPETREVGQPDARVLLVHGSPADPVEGRLYPDTDLTALSDLPYDMIACGHTHRPFIRATPGPTVVNVGSVGLPRDAGDLASFAVVDTGRGDAEILRRRFDAESVIAAAGREAHSDVQACLRRTDPDAFGRILL